MSALETRISDRIQFFVKRREVELPTLRERLTRLEAEWGEMCFEQDPRAWYRQRDAVRELQAQVSNIEGREEEYDYLLDIAKYIRSGPHPDRISDPPPDVKYDAPSQEVDARVPAPMQAMVQVGRTYDHGSKYAEYMHSVEKDVTVSVRHKDQMTTVCPGCGKQDLVDNASCSELICTSCALVTPYLGHTRANLTFEQDSELCHTKAFSYKKISRYEEIVSQFQATDNTDIPPHVIDRVRAELIKSRVTDFSKIRPRKVKLLLKNLDLSEYYGCHVQITKVIGGDVPPPFPPLLREKLRSMFLKTLDPFERTKHTVDKERTNGLSYPFVIYKMLEILNETKYLNYIDLLKSTQKLYFQDRFWKAICAELEWPFIRTV